MRVLSRIGVSLPLILVSRIADPHFWNTFYRCFSPGDPPSSWREKLATGPASDGGPTDRSCLDDDRAIVLSRSASLLGLGSRPARSALTSLGRASRQTS